MAATCTTCGAPDQGGFVCHFCGLPTRTLASAEEEARALGEYHVALTNAEDEKVRVRLLENGFLPSQTEVLVDAGLRMLPTLENAVAEHQAAGRLQAIISKLRIAGGASAGSAADELARHLARYRRSDRVMGYWVMGILGGLLFAIGWWIWG